MQKTYAEFCGAKVAAATEEIMINFFLCKSLPGDLRGSFPPTNGLFFAITVDYVRWCAFSQH